MHPASGVTAFQFHTVQLKAFEVRIHAGKIYQFQFHTVQLKADGFDGDSLDAYMFQFHTVQLKDWLQKHLFKGSRRFNSIRFN